jgi:hypothetical protein
MMRAVARQPSPIYPAQMATKPVYYIKTVDTGVRPAILGAGKYGDMANRWACRLALADPNLGRPLNMRASRHWSASWRSWGRKSDESRQNVGGATRVNLFLKV